MDEPKKKKSSGNSQIGVTKAVVLLLYEIGICLVYAFLFGYDSNFNTSFFSGDLLMVSVLALLAVIGKYNFI